MGFDTPWWNELGVTAGHSITDLPMRQCYYFGTAKVTDHSMLLGSYGDMETETFWKALSDDTVKFRPRATRLASQLEVEALSDVAASDTMVKEVPGLVDLKKPARVDTGLCAGPRENLDLQYGSN